MLRIVLVDNLVMRSLVALVIVGCIACTARNPAFCGDGTCIDPERPFCDVDGSLGGTPGTCIAVSCTPGTFAGCRGDQAIACANGGNTYDVVECPLGCDAAANGCRECTANAQCDSGTPVCDSTTSTCRACAADDECDSRVCDTGVCVPADGIVYAAPGVFGSCSFAQPCSIGDAVVIATNASVQPIIRMLPGTYSEPLDVELATATPLRIVATGATVAIGGDTPAITVDKGATVEIRGISVTGVRLLTCGSASAAPSSALFQSSALLALGGSAGGLMALDHCSVTWNSVTLESGDDSIALGASSSFHLDRARLRATNTALSIVQPNVTNVDVEVTNSVLENVTVNIFSADTTAPGSRYKFAYDTFVYNRPQDACSRSGPHLSVRFENTILAQQMGSLDAITNPANCSFVSSILSHQTAPAPAGTVVADPQFVNEAGRDFHLKSTSPAINAATAGTLTSDHDFDGVLRPQGAAADIGAFELKP
jgi:hypothetical protein